ncbi:MAG: hypothetical protein NC483_01995 [Ruminococcus sp.]|nr:hypothetical protein [Ruminococcus sp.]
MLKKVINFLDKHRFILVLLILFIVVIAFISFKSIMFLNHDFEALNCTKDKDEVYCYNNDTLIYDEPEKMKKDILSIYKSDIENIKKEYKLPELDMYTLYFYQVAVSLEHSKENNLEELLIFFKTYVDTYNLEEFYIENSFFYSLFKDYKLPINIS